MYRNSRIKKTNRLRRLTKYELKQREDDAFQDWLKSHRHSKTSQQIDLPSSQLRKNEDLVSLATRQIFAVIDTCSIVKHRVDFMNSIVRLKKIFPKYESPIKYIISIEVLRELDKYNRRPKGQKRSSNTNNNSDNNVNGDHLCENNDANSSKQLDYNQSTSKTNAACGQDRDPYDIFVDDFVKLDKKTEIADSPPRMFMRFLEEELRDKNVLIPELNPGLKGAHGNMEILNSDDRILNCCLAATEFIENLPHHPGTQVVLITEDNLFKSKATTLDVISYRWKEFDVKFRNFGLEHYVSTPLVPISREPVRYSLGNNPWSYKPQVKPEPRANKAPARDKRILDDSLAIIHEVINIID